MSVQPSQLNINAATVVPPRETGSESATALVPAQAAVPALPPTRHAQAVADYALPAAAGSAWLLSLGLAFTQGGSLPLLAAVTAAGVGSGLAIARGLVQKRVAAPNTHDPAMAQTHFNYATDTANEANLRVAHAYKYVCATSVIPGADALHLFRDLPRGRQWGIVPRPFGNGPTKFQSVLRDIGLRQWRQYAFVPYDVETVITGLAKLGPVTDQQRTHIQAQALDIMGRYYNRSETSNELQADLVAGVRELVRRAPSAAPSD